jgi:hypothetical protein
MTKLRVVTMSVVVAGVMLSLLLWNAARADEKAQPASDTKEQLAKIENQLVALNKNVDVIREDLHNLLNRKWEYRVEVPNRLKSRDYTELFNSLSKEGWELYMPIPNEGFVFRRPLQ